MQIAREVGEGKLGGHHRVVVALQRDVVQMVPAPFETNPRPHDHEQGVLVQGIFKNRLEDPVTRYRGGCNQNVCKAEMQ